MERSPHPADCVCVAHPLPASMRVREARDCYLRENGFSVEAYDAPKTEAAVLGVRVHVPNTARHRWAIMLHDLHHVATGYGTDMAGEGEISAWEARGGLRPLGIYVGSIVLSGGLAGLLIAPRRTIRAWRKGEHDSLFAIPLGYEELLELTVGELRTRLGIPRGGLMLEPRRLHAYAPPSLAGTR